MSDETKRPGEPGPQADSMLRTGTLGTMWLWLLGVVAAGLVVATLFAVNPPGRDNAVNTPTRPQATMNAPPQPPSPGRNTTGSGTPGPVPQASQQAPAR